MTKKLFVGVDGRLYWRVGDVEMSAFDQELPSDVAEYLKEHLPVVALISDVRAQRARLQPAGKGGGAPAGVAAAMTIVEIPGSNEGASAETPRTTFDVVADIIAVTCGIPREKITPEQHIINDLGVDSLDFLDVAFTVDRVFCIKIPLEQWTQEVNEGKTSSDEYFVMAAFCERVDEFAAAKNPRSVG